MYMAECWLAPIMKIRKTCLRQFGHVRKTMEIPVGKADQIKNSTVKMGRGRSKTLTKIKQKQNKLKIFIKQCKFATDSL